MNAQLQVLKMVKRRKLVFFGHACRQKALLKDLIVGIHPRRRKRGRPRRQYNDDIKKWMNDTLSEAIRKTENREQWKTLVCAATRKEDG